MTFADEAFDILGFSKEEKYDVFKVRMDSNGRKASWSWKFNMIGYNRA